MQLSLPTADLKAAFADALQGALKTEQALSAAAQDEIRRLVDDLYPLVTAEAQELLTASNPQAPQAYLAVLEGVVQARIAKLGLQAIAAQHAVINNALQTSVRILALVLRAAVIA